jgi:hypothetical protein
MLISSQPIGKNVGHWHSESAAVPGPLPGVPSLPRMKLRRAFPAAERTLRYGGFGSTAAGWTSGALRLEFSYRVVPRVPTRARYLALHEPRR